VIEARGWNNSSSQAKLAAKAQGLKSDSVRTSEVKNC